MQSIEMAEAVAMASGLVQENGTLSLSLDAQENPD
jgi:hypothetical protein